MISTVFLSEALIFLLLVISFTNIQCHLETFSSREISKEYNITVDNNNSTEDEFPIRELDVPEDVSSYYWCVEAVLNNVVKDEDDPDPTEIIFSNGKDIRSMRLPVPWYDDNEEILIVRGLSIFCHDGPQTLNDSLRVLVNTRSVKPINLSLNVSTCTAESQKWKEETEDGKLSFTAESKMSLTHPLIKEFLPEKLERFGESNFVLVKLETASDCKQCLIVTILQPGCSTSDYVRGQREGLKQTMRTRAAFLINPLDFHSGLVLSVVLDPSNKECCENLLGTNWESCLQTSKLEDAVLNISISSDSSLEDYIYGVLFILGFDFLVVGISATISAFGFDYDGESFENTEEMEIEEVATDHEDVQPRRQTQATCFISMADLEALGIEVNDKHANRMKHNITLADLSKETGADQTEGHLHHDSHTRVILILSLFYSIPTFQVVIWDAMFYSKSGFQDYCYYNFLCLKPFAGLAAFNHIFSNIGYVFYSILFIYLVHLKKRKYNQAIQKLENFDGEKFGTPPDFSLFYGIGWALLMEGIMSACYHVCPTNIYFQFDTTYMYLIGILMIVKLYQNRHPDVSLGALKTGILLGLLLFFETTSFYENRIAFWIIFCLIYFTFIIIVALNTYTLGALKYNRYIFWSSIRLLSLEVRRALGPHYKNTMQGQITSVKIRLLFNLIFVMYNVGHVIYIITKLFSEPDNYASTHLLVMIMANLTIYTVFYIIMKLVHKEYLTWSCRLYLIASLILMSTSSYFFSWSPKNQDGSPASSRAENMECILFNFYDSHDLWHFLSAGGLFTAFMFILNIDEDLKYTDRSFIPVF